MAQESSVVVIHPDSSCLQEQVVSRLEMTLHPNNNNIGHPVKLILIIREEEYKTSEILSTAIGTSPKTTTTSPTMKR